MAGETIRPATEEERKRLPYVRDASDPLAWREEPGVEESEGTWDALLLGAPLAARGVGRFTRKLADKFAQNSALLAAGEAEAAQNAAAARARKSVKLREQLGKMSDTPITSSTDTPLATPDMVRKAMDANQAGTPITAKNLVQSKMGRPWPDFLPGATIEHKGRTYWLNPKGDVFDEAGTRVLEMGTSRSPATGAVATNFTFYKKPGSSTFHVPERGSPLSGLASKVREKLAEVHGNVTSDVAGTSSPDAIASWERAKNVFPLPKTDLNAAKFVMKHPEGGAIRKIVEDLNRRGRKIDMALVEEWLKKYGGNAVLGAAGLESLRRYLEHTVDE